MCKLLRVSLAVAGLFAAAGMSIAVQPPGGRPQGGKGGVFGGGGVAGLIRSKTVQNDVKITEDQASKLKDWAKDFQPKMMEIMKDKMEGVDREDREKLMAGIAVAQAEISKVVYKELSTVLKPEQVTRLKQIEVQVDGLRAFAKPEVKEALKITDEQVDKIKDAGETAMKDLRELGEEYGVRFPGQRPTDADKAKEFDKKSSAITKEAMTKIMGTMSADQKKTWEGLTGPVIDVAKVRAETQGGGMTRKKMDD